MRLNRIEIRGFKSISRKTVLTFPGQVTCIAGPNGCGKSNVIDAMRWAIGEQSARSLRAGSMGDVIFSGTSDAPPGGMARVALEFVDDGGYFPPSLEGFESVSIARKLFRTGESQYTINDARCRLKDVNEIFLDTGLYRNGYAIIEQGKIKDIIQAKPEDIRALIEEVAEVGKFRVKRAEALKRLEATSGNLERIQDLLGEVGKQRNSLKSQANKAKRYQELKEESNQLTLLVWTADLSTIELLKSGLEARRDLLDRQYVETEQQLAVHTTELEAANQAMYTRRHQLQAVREGLGRAHGKAERARSDRAAASKRREDLHATFAMLNARIEQALGAVEESRDQLQKGRGEVKVIDEQLAAERAEADRRQQKLDRVTESSRALELTYDKKRADLFDVIGHVRAMDQRQSALRRRLQEVTQNLGKRRDELAGMSGEEEQLFAERDVFDVEITAVERRLDELREQVRIAGEEQSAGRERIDRVSREQFAREKEQTRLKAEIAMLERIIRSGAPEAAADGGVRVAEHVQVRAGYEQAVGRALGDILDYRVIADHAELPDSPEGVPGYVLASPPAPDDVPAPAGEGLVGPLTEGISAVNGSGSLVAGLSHGLWVVEDLAAACALWKSGERSCTYVTLDGMVLEPSGTVRTGTRLAKYGEVLKARTDREELKKQLAALETEIEEGRRGVQEAKDAARAIEKMIEQTAAEQRTVNKHLEDVRSRRQEVARRLDRMSDRRASFQQDVTTWEEMEGRLKIEFEDLSLERAELDAGIETRQARVKELDEQRAVARKTINEAQRAVQEQRTKLGELSVRCASRREQLKGLERAVDQREQEISRDRAQVETFSRTEDEINEAIRQAGIAEEEAKGEAETCAAGITELQPRVEEAETAARNCTAKVEVDREALKKIDKERSEVLLKHKEQEIAYKMRYERLEARFGAELPEVPADFDGEETRERISELQGKIERIGQINFTSIEAYEEAQSRWDDLHRQYEDLIQAAAKLKEVIANIERTCTREFNATFTKVRANFQEIFATMFDGGQADLVLEEGNAMEAGVEIFACPPFKRPKAMTLLSEGEKTLCAISFIFALFKVRPSPFCIMDEVDAPLDDANVERFNRLIRAFSAESQFVIVSHKRPTMEMADVIYGVTFDQPGITKVVSVDLSQAFPDEEGAA